MGHYVLVVIWAVATAACAGLGGAYLADAINVRDGIMRSLVPSEAGIGVMLLVLAGCIYRIGVRRLLP